MNKIELISRCSILCLKKDDSIANFMFKNIILQVICKRNCTNKNLTDLENLALGKCKNDDSTKLGKRDA